MIKKKLLICTSSSITINSFFYNHIKILSKDYKLILLTNTSKFPLNDEILKLIDFYEIPILRKINFGIDLLTFFKLIFLLLQNKPDIVLTVTPKAGLLAQIASFLTLRKKRVHFFTGQVWANYKGFKMIFFKSIDRLICLLATNILVDGKSQQDFLLKKNILNSGESTVLLQGSICGVDLKKFKASKKMKILIREKCGIKENEKIILFLGRFNRDKGIYDLLSAFAKIKRNDTYLLMVGFDEDNLSNKIEVFPKKIRKKIIILGHNNNPEFYLAAADILCLPSYREGFATVVLEAAACKLPAVVSDIYGMKDSIIHKKTGLFFKTGNIKDLSKSIEEILSNEPFRKKLGLNSYNRIRKYYDSKKISLALRNYIHSLIN